MTDRPFAVAAAEAPPRKVKSLYPAEFAGVVEGREKRPLGDLFGLTAFGVNLTRLAPGASTALLHRHTRQDEFVYVLEGRPTLVTEWGERELAPGDCAGFPAGRSAHKLENRLNADVVLLEIGDRTSGDTAEYPHDDLRAEMVDGAWRFTRKDGTPY